MGVDINVFVDNTVARQLSILPLLDELEEQYHHPYTCRKRHSSIPLFHIDFGNCMLVQYIQYIRMREFDHEEACGRGNYYLSHLEHECNIPYSFLSMSSARSVLILQVLGQN